jgi:hypothetical protein
MISPLPPRRCKRCLTKNIQTYDGVCNPCIEKELDELERGPEDFISG